MATLTIVAGLPGSGKSHLIREMKQASGNGGVFIEDYMKGSHGPQMPNSRHHDAVVFALRDGNDCAISDIEFVRQKKQIEIVETIREEVPDVTIRWICFKNEWIQCLQNVDRRAGDDVEKFERDGMAVIRLTRHFHIPEGAKMEDVFRPSNEKYRQNVD